MMEIDGRGRRTDAGFMRPERVAQTRRISQTGPVALSNHYNKGSNYCGLTIEWNYAKG